MYRIGNITSTYDPYDPAPSRPHLPSDYVRDLGLVTETLLPDLVPPNSLQSKTKCPGECASRQPVFVRRMSVSRFTVEEQGTS
jgi:hypothetical protein